MYASLIREVWEVVDINYLDVRGTGFSKAKWATLRDEALAKAPGDTKSTYRQAQLCQCSFRITVPKLDSVSSEQRFSSSASARLHAKHKGTQQLSCIPVAFQFLFLVTSFELK